MCSPTIYFIVKKFSRMNFSMSVFWPCGESGKISSLVKISCYTVICTRFSFMRVTYYIHIHQRLSSWLLHCICMMFSIKIEANHYIFCSSVVLRPDCKGKGSSTVNGLQGYRPCTCTKERQAKDIILDLSHLGCRN